MEVYDSGENTASPFTTIAKEVSPRSMFKAGFLMFQRESFNTNEEEYDASLLMSIASLPKIQAFTFQSGLLWHLSKLQPHNVPYFLYDSA